MLTGGVNRGLPGIILFRFTNGEGNVISDFDVITQPDPQRLPGNIRKMSWLCDDLV